MKSFDQLWNMICIAAEVLYPSASGPPCRNDLYMPITYGSVYIAVLFMAVNGIPRMVTFRITPLP